jgi:hypothetical protein
LKIFVSFLCFFLSLIGTILLLENEKTKEISSSSRLTSDATSSRATHLTPKKKTPRLSLHHPPTTSVVTPLPAIPPLPAPARHFPDFESVMKAAAANGGGRLVLRPEAACSSLDHNDSSSSVGGLYPSINVVVEYIPYFPGPPANFQETIRYNQDFHYNHHEQETSRQIMNFFKPNVPEEYAYDRYPAAATHHPQMIGETRGVCHPAEGKNNQDENDCSFPSAHNHYHHSHHSPSYFASFSVAAVSPAEQQQQVLEEDFLSMNDLSKLTDEQLVLDSNEEEEEMINTDDNNDNTEMTMDSPDLSIYPRSFLVKSSSSPSLSGSFHPQMKITTPSLTRTNSLTSSHHQSLEDQFHCSSSGSGMTRQDSFDSLNETTTTPMNNHCGSSLDDLTATTTTTCREVSLTPEGIMKKSSVSSTSENRNGFIHSSSFWF